MVRPVAYRYTSSSYLVSLSIKTQSGAHQLPAPVHLTVHLTAVVARRRRRPVLRPAGGRPGLTPRPSFEEDVTEVPDAIDGQQGRTSAKDPAASFD